jgi:EmrB/QacA subfamily drug resistance transporter
VTGLVVFTFGSAMCGLAASELWLVGFRMVQAVGGSMMTPVALAIVTNVFTAPSERARAIGWWAAVSGIGIAAGPLIGGFLVDSLGWKSIFWINVPTGIVAAILAFSVVPESKAAAPRAFDPVGQILVITFLVSVVFGIIEGPNRGWASPLIAGCFVIAASTLTALVSYERRHRQPLVQVGLFTTASFAGSFVMAMVGFLSFAGLLFANTLYLQNVLDLAASTAGLVTLPLALATIIAAPLSGRLMARSGARRPLVFAGVALAAGPLILLLFTEATPLVWLAVPYLIFGAGYGMLNAPINNTAISDLPDDQAGVASAMISTAKQVGSVLGIAIVGTILVSGTGGNLAAGLVTASTLAWWLLAACGGAIAVIAARAAGTPLPVARATAIPNGSDIQGSRRPIPQA